MAWDFEEVDEFDAGVVGFFGDGERVDDESDCEGELGEEQRLGLG